jgi:SPP1 gp7 family putative phage head morphogenesis protein
VLGRYNEFLQSNVAQSKKEYAQLGLFNVQDLLTELNVVFDKINTEAIENFVALSASNTPLGEVFQKHFPGIEQSISDIMLNGLVEGLNPRQIARNMTQASNIAQRKAEIIARTELLRAYRIANNEAYKASGVVEKYRRLAAKSNRTCIACIAQDGKIFDISEPLYDHPNGRCTSEPIISGRPELNSRELARDWLRKLPSQRQLLILGKSRYEMLRKGEIDWDSLVDVTENKTWGKSLTPKALKDL